MPTQYRYYMLDADGEVVGTDDAIAWSFWFEHSHTARVVQQDGIQGTNFRVSTIFVGLDRAFGRGDKPVLWETLTLGVIDDGGVTRRYTSKADAVQGHAEALAELQTKYAAHVASRRSMA